MSKSAVVTVEPCREDAFPGQGLNAVQAVDRAGRRFVARTEAEARQMAEDYNQAPAMPGKARTGQDKAGRS